MSPDRAPHALRVAKGWDALQSRSAVPRWCTWVVGVADVSSDVLRVKLSTGPTELGAVCAPIAASQYRFGLRRVALSTCFFVFRCEEMVDPTPAPIAAM